MWILELKGLTLAISFPEPGCDTFGQLKGNEGSGNETASLVPHEVMKIKRWKRAWKNIFRAGGNCMFFLQVLNWFLHVSLCRRRVAYIMVYSAHACVDPIWGLKMAPLSTRFEFFWNYVKTFKLSKERVKVLFEVLAFRTTLKPHTIAWMSLCRDTVAEKQKMLSFFSLGHCVFAPNVCLVACQGNNFGWNSRCLSISIQLTSMVLISRRKIIAEGSVGQLFDRAGKMAEDFSCYSKKHSRNTALKLSKNTTQRMTTAIWRKFARGKIAS